MTQNSPPEASSSTPTPGEIEAALSDLRARLDPPSVPENAENPPLPPPADEPRGTNWVGLAFIAMTAALLGAGAATYLPPLVGVEPQNQQDAKRRIEALEAKISQMATGQSGAVAAQSFADLKAHLDGLEIRLRALEASSGGAASEVAAERAELAEIDTALKALADRVTGVEGQLADIAARPVAVPEPIAPQPAQPTGPDPVILDEIAALKTALSTLGQRLGQLEQAAPAGDLIASLDGRVSELENADPGRASRQAALALIVARLGDAASAGRGFAAELAALKRAAPSVDAGAFEAYAEKGLPTVRLLAEQLDQLDRAVRDGADQDRGGDWFDRFWRGVGGLIIVRREGLAGGTEPEDHLARAHYHAGRGDLGYAVAEIDSLTGAARAAAAVWLLDAKARLALDAALARLTEMILDDLSRPAP